MEDDSYSNYDYYPDNETTFADLRNQSEMCAANFERTPYPEGLHCNSTWDGLMCWDTTPANTTVSQPCSQFFKGINLTNDTRAAHRYCNSLGMWHHEGLTNYTLCIGMWEIIPTKMLSPEHVSPTKDPNEVLTALVVVNIYFFGGILSLLVLGLTLFIFTYFKALHCSRISIHKNFVASFILRSIILIIYSEPYVTGRTKSFRDVDWLCKLLSCVLIYSYVANILWMFVEGLFLHNRIAVTVFHTDAPFRVFYSVGWVLPALVVFPWAMCMHFYNPKKCWSGYFHDSYVWILLVPLILALLLNAVFLVNIIRILITRLRANNTLETDQVRKAVKATAVLFPLLGMTNMLFFIDPGEDRASEAAYTISNAVLQSSQGIFVSVIYCFMNAEVRLAIRSKWLRYQNIRMGRNHNRRQSYRTSSMFLSTSEGTNYSLNRKGSSHTSPHLCNNIVNGASSATAGHSQKKPRVIMSTSLI